LVLEVEQPAADHAAFDQAGLGVARAPEARADLGAQRGTRAVDELVAVADRRDRLVGIGRVGVVLVARRADDVVTRVGLVRARRADFVAVGAQFVALFLDAVAIEVAAHLALGAQRRGVEAVLPGLVFPGERELGVDAFRARIAARQ